MNWERFATNYTNFHELFFFYADCEDFLPQIKKIYTDFFNPFNPVICGSKKDNSWKLV